MKSLLCVANLSRSAQAAEIDLSPWRGRTSARIAGPDELPANRRPAPYLITLAPYGFFWFQLCEPSDDSRSRRRCTPDSRRWWSPAAGGRCCRAARARSWSATCFRLFLAGRRWFSERGQRIDRDPHCRHHPLQPPERRARDCSSSKPRAGARPATYLLPLAIRWTRLDRERTEPDCARRGAAGARGKEPCSMQPPMQASSHSCSRQLRAPQMIEIERAAGSSFKPTSELPHGRRAALDDVRAVDTEQSNTTALVGNRYVVKLFRRIEPGINPEIEVGRFLTETCSFRPTRRALLGTVELRRTARAAQSRWCIGSWKIRVTPGRSPMPISTALSKSNACSPPKRRGTAMSRPPICSAWSTSGSG